MLFEATDPEGRKVRLARERFENHIVAEHGELKNAVEKLKRTIENPDCIYVKGTSRRRLYYRKSGRLYLLVVVRPEKTRNRGHVITAYRCKTISGGGELEWLKPRR